MNELPEAQRAVAERALAGGIPAVRQAVNEQNTRLRAEGKEEIPAAGLISIAEALLPRLRVAEWLDRADAAKSDLDRLSQDRAKTGAFTGAYAQNPASGELIPIYIADYVLMGYGTGAIFGCPAHDQRDLDFARTGLKFNMLMGKSEAAARRSWLEEHGNEAEADI